MRESESRWDRAVEMAMWLLGQEEGQRQRVAGYRRRDGVGVSDYDRHIPVQVRAYTKGDGSHYRSHQRPARPDSSHGRHQS